METDQLIRCANSSWRDLAFLALEGQLDITSSGAEIDTGINVGVDRNSAPQENADVLEEELRGLEQCRQCYSALLLVPQPSVTREVDVAYWRPGAKFIWNRASGSSNAWTAIYEVLDEYLGLPGEAVASMSEWSEFWKDFGMKEADWSEPFYYNRPHRILFSKEIAFKTAELPRWKPTTFVDVESFDEDDD